MTQLEQKDAAYEMLQQQLATANASIEAAEVHGVICGLLSTGQALPDSWFDELFDQAEDGDLLVSDCRQAVEGLFAQTEKQLSDEGAGMQLLLPTDTVALPIRARAVADWCQGFLYGIGMAGEQLNHLPDDAQESIQDISSISQLDLNDIGVGADVEEEEQALTEITEFLWVAAMLIRENMHDQAYPMQQDQDYDDYH